MGVTRFLADKSALARLHLPPVREVLVPLMERGLFSGQRARTVCAELE